MSELATTAPAEPNMPDAIVVMVGDPPLPRRWYGIFVWWWRLMRRYLGGV